MPTFIDIHEHVLFGMDDGAGDLKMAQQMVDEAVAEGVRFIIATPHIQPGMKVFDWKQYQAALGQLNDYCLHRGYLLEIFGGAEIKYSEATARLLQAGQVPTMNDTRFILVEWRTTSSYTVIYNAVRELTNAGYRVIMAHVERYSGLYGRCAIETFKATFDVRVQVNCDAVLGRGTFFMRLFVRRLLKKELVDYVATDAHDLNQRSIKMAEAYQLLKARYGKRYARDITGHNQLEMFQGGSAE